MHEDATWYGDRPHPRGLCVRWGPSLPPKKGAKPPICGPYLLWPNGLMDQDGTWHGGRPQPRRLCFRWGLDPSPKRGPSPQSPIFIPFLLRPNGWMHEDVTWYGDRPHPRGLVFVGDPASLPKRGRSPQFSAHIYCGQTAAWIMMPLGTEAGLGPDDIVLDGDPALPPQKGASPLPYFRPMSIVAKRLDGSRWHLAWRWALVHATMC